MNVDSMNKQIQMCVCHEQGSMSHLPFLFPLEESVRIYIL